MAIKKQFAQITRIIRTLAHEVVEVTAENRETYMFLSGSENGIAAAIKKEGQKGWIVWNTKPPLPYFVTGGGQ